MQEPCLVFVGAEDEAKYLDAVERMIFEGSEDGALADAPAESPEMHVEHFGSDDMLEVSGQQKPLPAQSISMCNNPFFNENPFGDDFHLQTFQDARKVQQLGNQVANLVVKLWTDRPACL